jgi:hypothetical protein
MSKDVNIQETDGGSVTVALPKTTFEDTRRDLIAKRVAAEEAPHVHQWSRWQEIGRTGDWFHPLIVERTCVTCGAIETDEH